MRASLSASAAFVPDVKAWQMRAELLALGKLEDFEKLVKKNGGEFEIRWNYDPVCARANPAWDQLMSQLDIEADDIFRSAAGRE